MRFETGHNVNRCAIYVFHDSDGIVDNYVPTFLKELKKFTTYLLVVINGRINSKSYLMLVDIVDDVLIRPNEGYDITGYKAGIEYIGWKKLLSFDECILVNSTLYGPLYPFEEMFSEMDMRDVDFWGITKHHKVDFDVFGTCKYGYIPEHIQSSFLVVRKSMGKAKIYQDMWKNLPEIHSYAEAIGFFEVIFTKESEEKGFVSSVYIDTSDLEGYTRYPLMMMVDELVINRRCPVIKQKCFSQNYYDILTDTVGYATIELYDFLRSKTNYDTNLIWENILRLNNMYDIKNIMQLNYILPKEGILQKYIGEKRKSKIALVIHIYYPELVDYCLKYCKSMPVDTDLYVTTPSISVAAAIRKRMPEIRKYNVRIIEIENRGRDVSALLVGFAPFVKNYDYVCFAHDKKTTQVQPYCNGESFSYQCFENILGSSDYVKNIIKTFDENPRLGILTPPTPSHGNFYVMIGSEWAGNFENVIKLAEELKLKTDINPEKPPIAPLGTMFWFRPEALEILYDQKWGYEDFPAEPNGVDGTLLHAIERIYPIVAQEKGYYSAWCMTDKFASIETTNLYFTLRELNLKCFPYYCTSNLLDMVSKFDCYVARQEVINTQHRRIMELEKKNEDLYWQTSLKYQLKLRLKRILPRSVFGAVVRIKRLLMGPHGIRYNYDD